MVRFGLLGPVVLWSAGKPVVAGPPRQRLVLASLLLDAGRLVTSEQLVDRVWGQVPPATARRSLHSHIARIRKTLAQTVFPGHQPPRLVHASGGYLLEVEPDQVDMHRFRRMVAQAARAARADHERISLLCQAFGLWRGEPLAGLPGQWAARVRSGWHQQRVQAAVAWAVAAQRLGDAAGVIAVLSDLAAEYPLAEPLVTELMRALFATGRGSEALEHYTALRSRLNEELGTEPGPELRDMHRTVLRGDHTRPAADSMAEPAPMVPHVFGIRTGLTVPLILPADLTELEAQRLADYIRTLAAGPPQPALSSLSAMSSR